MLNVGDKVRMIVNYDYECEIGCAFVTIGDIGVVVDADHAERLYRIKFGDWWGGTMEMFLDETYPAFEKVTD